MDQLIEQIVQKTGISPEHARTAVTMAMGFLKGKLPAPLAAQMESALAGGGEGGGGGIGDIAKSLGGLLGGSKPS